MCIRRRASYKPTIHRVLYEVVASGTVEARCIDLGKAATLDPAVQDVPIAADVDVALDVGEDRRDALQLQTEDDVHVGRQAS